jgi:ABC-2 type transport system ATP-binding protein
MIELSRVAKHFRGPWFGRGPGVRALDGVDLRVDAGTALGVVGLNGAGKSTLLRVLLGYAHPTSGSVRIGGVEPREYAQRHGIAYLPERVTIPRHWTVGGALHAFAMLGEVGRDAPARIRAALARLGLEQLAPRRVGTLSKGNLQRLGIAQAILADRRIMVLDEITDGLDPIWIVELRSIIAEWRAGGRDRVLILASHNLPEVARLTDRVIILHNGKIRGELAPTSDAESLEREFLTQLRQLESPRP